MHRVVLLAPLLLLLAAACARPAPLIPREDAIGRATTDAARSRPGLGVLEARVDEATAELTTLGEAVHLGRLGDMTGPRPDGAGPAWLVTVRGRFRFEAGPSAAGLRAAIYEADEQVFLYDARSGAPIGGRVPTRPAP